MDKKEIEINPLIERYERYIEKINQSLESELNMYSESEFSEPLKYAIENGKRIRPVILLLAAESIGKVDDSTFLAACAIEFLHTESVIHDDIIDNETIRRQNDPFHIKFGYNASVLTGDFVLGLILNIGARLNNPRIIKDIASAAMMMSEGEILEERLQTGEDVNFNDYLKVIEYKTAAAFETAAKIGAIITGGSEEEIKSLSEYGKYIGIAYQIRDDLQDWQNEEKIFNILIKKTTDPRHVFDKMEEMLKEYTSNALSSIRNLPESQAKNELENLIKFTQTKA